MKLPKQVTVAGMPYSVTQVTDLTSPLADDAFCYGTVMHTVPAIQVESTLAERVKVQALVHEVMHALFHQTGHIDYVEDERLIRMLGCQLPILLRENPELVAAIMEGGNE
jgi:hypothetical protein